MPIDGAEIITMDEIKHLKLPYFEGLAAGYPSPAGDYQHESLDLNDKFVHHEEASYFVRVSGESMIGLGIYDGDICLEIGRASAIKPGWLHVPAGQICNPFSRAGIGSYSG